MKAIYIPQLLQMPGQTAVVEVDGLLPSLETLTPVQGQLQVAHCGNYLNVSGRAETIITLTCDRCLQQYNHRLSATPTELIWLKDAEEPQLETLEELEIAPEDLVETLPQRGTFDPETWLYEQLCLAIPQRQLCDPQCPGIAPAADSDAATTAADRRWAALEALKRSLQSQG